MRPYGWVSDADEFRAEAAEIVQHRPVQRLHHRRIAVLVGVRERVTPQRNRATKLLPLGGVEVLGQSRSRSGVD